MTRYLVDTERFALDTLDGETIVMDLVDGRLFLLEDGAAQLWERLAHGEPGEDVLNEIGRRYGAPCREQAGEFIQTLETLGLLAPTDLEPAEPLERPWPRDLTGLNLTQYDDMTRIITMDPIHDVDPERGWPFSRQG